MAEWWESYKSADEPMRPMVAHASKSDGEWWKQYEEVNPDKGTLNEEPRTPAIGEDPRLAPDAVFNPEQTADVASDTAAGLALMGPLGASGRLARILGNPLTTGVVAGGRTLYKTGDPERAMTAAGAAMGAHYVGSKGLAKILGRITPAVEAEAAGAAPTIERYVAAEATPIAQEAAAIPASLPPMRDATPGAVAIRAADRRARQAAALAKNAAAPEAQTVAEVVEQAPRKLAPIPPKGQSRLPTVYTKTPTQGPKPLSEAQAALREKQLDAAKAAGVDLTEAFGTRSEPIVEAESPLLTRLRASVMMKKDPAGLVNEVMEKATSLSQSGMSRDRVGAAIEKLYGLTPDKLRQMADAVSMARGMK